MDMTEPMREMAALAEAMLSNGLRSMTLTGWMMADGRPQVSVTVTHDDDRYESYSTGVSTDAAL